MCTFFSSRPPYTSTRPIRSLIGSLLNQVDLRHVTGIYDLQFWRMPSQCKSLGQFQEPSTP